MNANTPSGRHRCWSVCWSTILPVALVLALLAVLFSAKLRSRNTPPERVLPELTHEPPPPLHPVFGVAQKTVGLDLKPIYIAPRSPGLKEAIDEATGRHSAVVPPPAPIQTDLTVGHTGLFWSSTSDRFGYLYFCARLGREPIWEFAPCSKAKLDEVTPQDLPARFVVYKDKTNGPACFGTNFLPNSIRVHQGQVILARCAADPNEVYALDLATLSVSNAVVFFVKITQ